MIKMEEYERQMIKMIRMYGVELRHIDYQTEEICLEAVIRDPSEIQDVKDKFRTDRVCKKALKKNGMMITWIHNPTEEMKKTAVRQNGRAIELIRCPSKEVCILALLQYPEAIEILRGKKDEEEIEELRKIIENKKKKGIDKLREENERLKAELERLKGVN